MHVIALLKSNFYKQYKFKTKNSEVWVLYLSVRVNYFTIRKFSGERNKIK